MNKKPLKYIIPRIHKLNDCYFIQWMSREYYINKCIYKRFFNLYTIIDCLLLIFVWIVAGVLPFKNIDDVLKMFLLALIIGAMNGFAIVEDRENSNK